MVIKTFFKIFLGKLGNRIFLMVNRMDEKQVFFWWDYSQDTVGFLLQLDSYYSQVATKGLSYKR